MGLLGDIFKNFFSRNYEGLEDDLGYTPQNQQAWWDQQMPDSSGGGMWDKLFGGGKTEEPEPDNTTRNRRGNIPVGGSKTNISVGGSETNIPVGGEDRSREERRSSSTYRRIDESLSEYQARKAKAEEEEQAAENAKAEEERGKAIGRLASALMPIFITREEAESEIGNKQKTEIEGAIIEYLLALPGGGDVLMLGEESPYWGNVADEGERLARGEPTLYNVIALRAYDSNGTLRDIGSEVDGDTLAETYDWVRAHEAEA